MSAKSIIATSVLSAVLVIGAAAPIGYFGYQKFGPKMTDGGNTVPSVVIELEAKLTEEIKTSAAQTRNELKAEMAKQDTAQTQAVEELIARVTELRREQESFITRIEKMETAEAERDMEKEVQVPGARTDAFNQTVLFPLAKARGKVIDNEIEKVAVNAKAHLQGGACTTNVLGFSDTLGNDEANLRLSQKRAEYVADRLRKSGVEISEVRGWGERWLAVHTLDGVKKPQNRRVVVEMTCGQMMKNKEIAAAQVPAS